MDPQEQRHKLDMIRQLTAGECIGWARYIAVFRQPFPGEMAALIHRAQQTGVTLPQSSRGGRSE